MEKAFQGLVDLGAHAEPLAVGECPRGGHHELLEGERVAGVAAAVDYVETRHRETQVGVPRESREVLVEREALVGRGGAGDRHGNPQDRVGADFGFVRGAVEGAHEGVELRLLGDLLADEGGGEELGDVLYGVADTFAGEPGGVLVAELTGFVDSGGGPGGDAGAEDAHGGGELYLDGGVSAGVKHLAGV